MADIIWGKVTKVIDGDTFTMNVTHISNLNKDKYSAVETIRIAGYDAPELSTPGGQKAKQDLFQKINGKEVKCVIQARDIYGRVIASVSLSK